MAYRIAVIPMTLNDLQDHLPTATLFKCDFSHSWAAVDKILTDMARLAVGAIPLQWLSFLFFFVEQGIIDVNLFLIVVYAADKLGTMFEIL